MILLDYSTAKKEIDRLPVLEPESASFWKKRKVAFISVLALLFIAPFIYGWTLNTQVGFILTALAYVPLAALIAISLFFAPRSEVSLRLRLVAVIWGAVGSTNLTLLVIDVLTKFFGTPDLNTTVVVQAAIVEEFCKGLFLFGMFVSFKHLIRTPMAGATLGILVGAGFAFVENIMYFNNAFMQGSWNGLWATVILRAGMSFFLHAMATMCTGLFIGYVVSRRTQFNLWKKLTFLDMGLLSAMTIHGMWNGMASLYTDNSKWHMLYLFFWIPLVAVVIITLILVRKHYNEQKKEIIIAAARRGYIRMSQAERITDKKSRKALYKSSEPLDIVQWETSLLKVQHWNDSIAEAKRDWRIRRLNKAKSKEMMKLARVVAKV